MVKSLNSLYLAPAVPSPIFELFLGQNVSYNKYETETCG